MTITREQVKEWLRNGEEIVKCAAKDFVEYAPLETVVRWEEYSEWTTTILDADIPVKSLLVYGGGEGDGETYYIVFQVGDTLWRVDGFYQSHYGSELDYDTLREVQATQKMITVYE